MSTSPLKKVLLWLGIFAGCGVLALSVALFLARQSDANFDRSLETSSLEKLRSISQSPEHDRDPLVFYWLGIRLGEAREDRPAVNALVRSVQLNANVAKSRYALGVALERANLPSEAEGQLKRAIELEPKRVEPYYVLGKMCGKYSRFREAETYLRKAVAIDPQDIEASFLLSVVLLELSVRTSEPYREEARDILLKLEKRAPQDTRILSLLASSHVFFNEIQEAEALYRRILAIQPDDLKSKALLGRSLAEQATSPTAFAEAEKLLAECAEKDPASPATPLAQGVLYFRQNQSARAIPFFRLAIERKTLEPEVWFYLGRALMQIGKKAEGQQATALFARKDKNKREVRSLQMRLGFETGDAPEQIKQSDDLHLQIARLLMDDTNYRAAETHLQAILSHNPNHAEAKNRLKRCQAEMPSSSSHAPTKSN